MLPPFHIVRDFLPEEERSALLDFALASEANFVAATVQRAGESVLDPKARISSTTSELGPFRKLLRDRLREASPGLFAAVGVKPFEVARLELELAAHNDGAHFNVHRDTLRLAAPVEGQGRTHRVVSGVYYFHSEPKAFSGGELRLLPFHAATGAAPIDIEPAQNSLVVFPAFAPHEVLRVSCPSRRFADSRFAVNCWFHRAA